MPEVDPSELLSFIKAILTIIFGEEVPYWIFKVVAVVGGILVLLWAVYAAIYLVKKIWNEGLKPLFHTPEERQRVQYRQRFAKHVELGISQLNNLESWSDYRFTDLEAEVEAEGWYAANHLVPFIKWKRGKLRRERSLFRTLETSRERLLLLEGEPGSGKSVALRHAALVMAQRAIRARNTKSVVPIYINLKELKRNNDETIDRELIYAFVLRYLNRVNDRDIEEFLESEFDKGIREGTWLFLFDSFDEIPDILSSTEADLVVQSYATAISAFFHGMNDCQGILASRRFRGPETLTWPHIRILPLSHERQLELVHKASPNTLSYIGLKNRLTTASSDIQAANK